MFSYATLKFLRKSVVNQEIGISKTIITLHKVCICVINILTSSLFSLANMSTSTDSTIEMDDILAGEVQNSVQQSAQSEYQNVLQRFSQAIDFSDPTKEIRILDLNNYLNDPTKSSEVKFLQCTLHF